MRGSSPMTSRSQSSFSGPYNPQQWGPVSSIARVSAGSTTGPRAARFAPRLAGADEPVASPPPPYSPRRDQGSEPSPHPVHETVSPSDTVSPATDPSQYGTPISAATTMSPDFSSHYSTRTPPPQIVPSQSDHISSNSTPSFPPPPPLTAGSSSRHRAYPKKNADRLLSTLGTRPRGSTTASPVTAIDALQERTVQALSCAPEASSADATIRPPASRRAASTGGIGLSEASSRSASHSSSQNQWEPGMPLPPPPPGPPPASARSQSLNRSSESLSPDNVAVSSLRARKPPGTGTALAPVPPTPAGWNEEAPSAPQSVLTSRYHLTAPLHIDTGSIVHRNDQNVEENASTLSANPYSAHLRRDSSSGGLVRSPAVRNRSAKGIRERRSESRNGKGRVAEEFDDIQSSTFVMSANSVDDVKPTDLVLPFVGGSLSKRRTATRASPRNSKDMLSLNGALNSDPIPPASGQAISHGSSNTSQQPEYLQTRQRSNSTTPTPPFSPTRVTFATSLSASRTSPSLPPKPLPTPPPQHSNERPLASSLVIPPLTDERPISHLLHIPNSDESIQSPLIPLARSTRQVATDLLGPESPKAFAQRAIERHRDFAEREAAASSDVERLELFTRFVVAESRIRRGQYGKMLEEEQIQIGNLIRGLFESTPGTMVSDESQLPTQSPKYDVTRDSRVSSFSASESDSNCRRSSSVVSRAHESPVSISTDCSSQNRPESTWWNDYIPSLSPIASMSIATGQDHDEMGSRGRASSRWWEDKSGESAQGDAFKVLQRSKRESKYMGLPRTSPALLENVRSTHNDLPPGYAGEATQQSLYGPDEYPPEKVGLHQQMPQLPPPPPHPPTPHSAPYTPDPRKLDISRLVTLPPPYPRHHPAVNNSHPDLANVRATVRLLHEMEEIDHVKESYLAQIEEKRQRAISWRKHQRSLHDQDIQFRMEHNEISQDEFDQAELEIEGKIAKSDRSTTQTDFDLFQNVVVSPLHAMLSERIAKATSSIQDLSSRLFSETQKHSPNLPQEEGDEQPELLEKLTQLKWLFDARESLHRKIFDLLTERNDKYKAIVLLPYQQSKNHEKYGEADSFFASDARERMVYYENKASARFDAFLTVIETNVTRGVEIQLSAFWDIVPPLARLLSRIPSDLRGFEVQIPQLEYEENPGYYEHPMQYLYSLLEHAQKSSYQFIESQINLLCLLHEIRCGVMRARFHAQKIEGEVETKVDEARRGEEGRLDEELKEKVGWVEGQWREALGEEMIRVRERVRGHLLEEGGWDDGVEGV
ncbi:MAG: hypothetical protein Q9190_002615 [Brigantiaea leucoxantha]